MLFKDVAKLITITRTRDSDGYPVDQEATTEVYVNVKSVKRSEFYASLQAGINTTKAFVMRSCDYDGQTIIEYEGKRYSVVRTYSEDGELIELNCSDLAV